MAKPRIARGQEAAIATTSPTSFRIARCLATIASLAAFAVLAPCAARATSPDAVQFQVSAVISVGSFLQNVNLATIPAGKRLVIQTITYTRTVCASGTIGQMFLTTTVNGSEAEYSVPEVPCDGAPYPASTAAVTIYADPGTTPSIACARGGSTSIQEYCTAAVSGYYAAVK